MGRGKRPKVPKVKAQNANAQTIPPALAARIAALQKMVQDPNHVNTPEMQKMLGEAMHDYAEFTGITAEDARKIHFGEGPISGGSEDLGTDSVRIPEDTEPLPPPSTWVELARQETKLVEEKRAAAAANQKASLLNPTNTGSLAPKPPPLGPSPKSQNPQTPINQNPPMNMTALSAAAQAKQASPAAASPMDMSALSPYSNPPLKVMDMGKLGPYSQQPSMPAPSEGQVNMQKLLTTLGMGAGGGLALEHIMKALYQKPEAQEQMYLSGPGPMVK